MPAIRRRSVRLDVEVLEARQLLSASLIVNHGDVQKTGAVDAIFYGPGWTTHEQSLETAIQSGLHGVIDPSGSGPNAYLETLENAHYGAFNLVFADSTNTSANARASLVNTVTDQDIENYLSYTLNHPYKAGQTTDRVDQDTSSRVYLVIVDADYAVQGYNGTLVSSYHRTFNALVNGHQLDVNYAVVAVPGGAAHNQPISALLINPQLDTVTANASSALIDAVTNPGGLGWHAQDAAQTEIGDSGVYAYVNNELVVRPYNKSEQWMLPAQATAPDSVTFLLDDGGKLWERSVTARGIVTVPILAPNGQIVTQVSDQGIDILGRAMVDFISAAGNAYEMHDGAVQPVPLYAASAGTAAVDAKAGQGVSYVLLSNQTVWEYDDLSGTVRQRSQNVWKLDAGTTYQGVNMVDVIDTSEKAWEVPDAGNTRSLKIADAVQISAGRQGRSAIIDASNTAWLYEEHGGLQKLATGIRSLAAGFDANGNLVVDLVAADTNVLMELDYQTAANGKLKPDPVLHSAHHLPAGTTTWVANLAPGGAISKVRAGVLDMVFADGIFEGAIDRAQLLLGTNFQKAG